jgi:ABC-type lipopolysaccharide export system ATPase subunit
MSSLVPASNVALTVEGLCKTYGKTVAVGPLSFSLTVGSTTGLLGGNGADNSNLRLRISHMSASFHRIISSLLSQVKSCPLFCKERAPRAARLEAQKSEGSEEIIAAVHHDR